jgi:hypothetical protein
MTLSIMTFYLMAKSITTFSITIKRSLYKTYTETAMTLIMTTLKIITLSLMTISVAAFGITLLSIVAFCQLLTFSNHDIQYNDVQNHNTAQLSIIILSKTTLG